MNKAQKRNKVKELLFEVEKLGFSTKVKEIEPFQSIQFNCIVNEENPSTKYFDLKGETLYFAKKHGVSLKLIEHTFKQNKRKYPISYYQLIDRNEGEIYTLVIDKSFNETSKRVESIATLLQKDLLF